MAESELWNLNFHHTIGVGRRRKFDFGTDGHCYHGVFQRVAWDNALFGRSFGVFYQGLISQQFDGNMKSGSLDANQEQPS